MQVSWIDSEHLKGLLRQLQDPASEPSAPETAPDSLLWEPSTPPPARALPLDPVPAPPEPPETRQEETAEEETDAPALPPLDMRNVPEVARIRDRLREVRERAEAAGLLKRPEPAAAPDTPPPESPDLSDTSDPSAPPTEPAPAAQEEADDSLYFEVPLGSVLERLDAFAEWARRRVAPAELLLLDEHGDLLLGAEARAALVLSVMLAASAARRSTAAGVCENAAVTARQPTPEGGELTVLSCPTRLGLIHLAVEHPATLPDSEVQLLRQALLSAIEVSAPESVAGDP